MATLARKIFTDWQALMQLTQGQPFVVERVRITGKEIALEGSFTLPQSSGLNSEDQIFITDFIRCHGSIEEMERTTGASPAVIKSRLNEIALSLPIVCCAWWRPYEGDSPRDQSLTSPG